MPAATLIMLRHGEVQSRFGDRLYGGADVPLSERGRRHSMRVARNLDTLDIATIHTSDLERTRFLAGQIAESRGIEVVEHTALREIDRGIWTGRRRSEVAATPGWLAYCSDPDHYAGHQAETGAQFMNRIRRALDEIVASADGDPLVVVCHRHVVCAALACLLGAPFKTGLRFQVDYLSATIIDWPRGIEGARDGAIGAIRLVNGTTNAVDAILEGAS